MKLAKLFLAASAAYLIATIGGMVAFHKLVPQPDLVRTWILDVPEDAPEQVGYRAKLEVAATAGQFGAQCAAAGLAVASMSLIVTLAARLLRRGVRRLRFRRIREASPISSNSTGR